MHSHQLLHDAVLGPLHPCADWELLWGPGHTGLCPQTRHLPASSRPRLGRLSGPAPRRGRVRSAVGHSRGVGSGGHCRTWWPGADRPRGGDGAGPGACPADGAMAVFPERRALRGPAPGQRGGPQRDRGALCFQDWGRGAWPEQGCPWRRVSLRGLGFCPGLFHDQ